MKNFYFLLLALCLMTISASTLIADVTLPSIIADNMVLQQKTTAPLWGFASPDEKVTVTTSWQKRPTSTTADKDGNWKVRIKTPKASGPHTITIKASNTITLNNVMTGEVWLCSGQSNMQWTMAKTDNAQDEIASAKHPNIRLFQVQRASAQEPINNCAGSWDQCTPETVKNFSAVAYLFGRNLFKELNIPIGLIHSSWGGTPAEAWTRREFIENEDDL
ncbi:MAG: hypothetical protein KAS23_03355, partial [Anaerohalosphaera sp.]|nr:hypothetical protein [Anaerohalosphaera sp.]